MALALHQSRYRKVTRDLDRFTDVEPVNFSARVEVVRRNEHGELELDPAYEPLLFGAIIDPMTCRYIAPAKEPAVTWQIGPAQYRPFEFMAERERTRLVMVAAMGAGKSEVLPMVAIAYPMGTAKHGGIVNADYGVLAPVRDRLGIVKKKFRSRLHPSWIVEERSRPDDEPPYILLVNQVKYQFVATKSQSGLVGSPVQGYDWIGAVPDEEQNMESEAIADIEMRGRAADQGWYPVISSCTISDEPQFRARLARYKAEDSVEIHRMPAFDNPFVEPVYWERLKAKLPPRQYNMRVLAIEEKPERATYSDYDAKRHVQPIPQLGAVPLGTSLFGKQMLIGYDPGTLCDVSILLKPYRVTGRRETVWFVVGELTTRPGHPQRHAAELKRLLKRDFGLTAADVEMRADPHGNSETRPHHTVYTEFKNAGFTIRPAVYKRNAAPARAADPGQLPKEARILVVNTLLYNAQETAHLYLAADERGNPIAEGLANAMEMSRRDESGRAEMDRKDEHDLSHWPAALGYALYPYEHARVDKSILAEQAEA